jgi:GT2 family glycosyltransferase
MDRADPVLAVVILQHGRARDTAACLQSLAPAVAAGHARVIVVDNASPDDAADHVVAWMHGEMAATPRPVHDTVATHWWPLTGVEADWAIVGESEAMTGPPPAWTLVRASENRGFAVGMNHGIRVALADTSVDAIWLLNNDTVVHPDAVAAIRQAVNAADSNVGQFGTTVCYYDRPGIVQSVGWCRWNPWLATSLRLHDGASTTQPLNRSVSQPGYVYGASWIIRSEALRDVGLLSEEGFLYGEELDWACRARERWRTALIEAAIVWHREGATIGAGAMKIARRSELVDLCGISARLRLSHRFFPDRLPTVYLSVCGAILNRVRRREFRRALAVARLALGAGFPAPRPAPSPALLSPPNRVA